jgi:hypothetical protein
MIPLRRVRFTSDRAAIMVYIVDAGSSPPWRMYPAGCLLLSALRTQVRQCGMSETCQERKLSASLNGNLE